jgi:anti-sigma regulatory factor (Ser/Thr protein kinase)
MLIGVQLSNPGIDEGIAMATGARTHATRLVDGLAGRSAGSGLSVVLCRSYPGAPAQVTQVRRDVSEVLDGCPAADTVRLCLSELATNAVLHSRSGIPGGHFTVSVAIRTGEHVTVNVTDDGGPWGQRSPADEIPRGHGLDIVAGLAAEMGINGDNAGRAVWSAHPWTMP